MAIIKFRRKKELILSFPDFDEEHAKSAFLDIALICHQL